MLFFALLLLFAIAIFCFYVAYQRLILKKAPPPKMENPFKKTPELESKEKMVQSTTFNFRPPVDRNNIILWEDAWPTKTHDSPAQRERIARRVINCNYETTFESCTCPDFEHRRKPCKHIYGLADKLKVLTYNLNRCPNCGFKLKYGNCPNCDK